MKERKSTKNPITQLNYGHSEFVGFCFEHGEDGIVIKNVSHSD